MPPYRLAVLSDIHASITALDAVLGALETFLPLDAILIAGDFTYGPSQPATLARLSERQVIAVRGNGDLDLLNFAGGKSPAYMQTLKQFSLIRWSLANTTPEALDFLQNLPEQRVIALPGAAPIRLVHGSPRDINETLSTEKNPGRLEHVLTDVPEPVLVFGHTHQALIYLRNRKLALNPGAVSMALGKPATAHFAILKWSEMADRWQAHLSHVSYDANALQQEFADSGLLHIGPLGRLLLATSLTGKSAGVDFMRNAFNLSAAAGYGGLPYIPDEFWERADEMFS
jgi:putative phosphoesterase